MQGFFLALCSALLWGLSPIFEKLGLASTKPLVGLCARTFAITVVLGATLLLAGEGKALLRLDPKSLALFAAGGITGGLLGHWTYFAALKHWEASKVVPLAATYPLVALVLGVIFLNESLSLQKAVGVVLIVLGVVLLR